MVMETDILFSGIWSNRIFISSNGINGHTGFAHITYHTFMIGIISAVCGQVKGNRKSLLAGCQIPPVKGIGLLCGGKTGILPDCPGLHHIHRRIRSPQKWR